MDGTPESVPMYPYEIATRLSDLGRLDYSAQPVMESTRDDLDPLERDRLRKIIASYQSSDRNLLELSDADLEKSLRLVVSVNGELTPTLQGCCLSATKKRCRGLCRRMRRLFRFLWVPTSR